MSPIEQILFNQKKQGKQLAQIMKRLSETDQQESKWISAEEAVKLTGYSKESLRKKGLTKNYKAGKVQYNLQELKQRNLIHREERSK